VQERRGFLEIRYVEPSVNDAYTPEIPDDELFEKVLHSVASILGAADITCLAAAGGRASPRSR